MLSHDDGDARKPERLSSFIKKLVHTKELSADNANHLKRLIAKRQQVIAERERAPKEKPYHIAGSWGNGECKDRRADPNERPDYQLPYID